MTYDEFLTRYAESLGCSVPALYQEFNLVAVECSCGEPDCEGWRMIPTPDEWKDKANG